MAKGWKFVFLAAATRLLDAQHRPTKGYDQVAHNVDLQKLPSISCNGLSKLVGADGPTHSGSFYVTYMVSLPNIACFLSGRDMLGITFMGSGKTLVFVLPLIMTALQEKSMMPIAAGIWISKIRHLLCIGGVDMQSQLDIIKRGVCIVVATPGRLKDLLAKKKMNLAIAAAALTTESVLNNVFDAISNPKLPICVSEGGRLGGRVYLTLDEADRLVDLGFEDDIREVFDHFKALRQTLLFSATMPAKIQNFSRSALVKLITVNVGGGVTNLDVIQEVEYVKQELKLVYLLECLQKTLPPDLVFCETKADVDNIDEYLLFKRSGISSHPRRDREKGFNYALRALSTVTPWGLALTPWPALRYRGCEIDDGVGGQRLKGAAVDVAVVMIGGRQYIVFPGRFLYTQRLKGAAVDVAVVMIGGQQSTVNGQTNIT
ncbi:DEAD-box ATP-dependent RNA helicase 35 [Tanacetum coccineum]